MRLPKHVWIVSGVVLAIVLAGFLTLLLTLTVNATPDEPAPRNLSRWEQVEPPALKCLRCHPRILMMILGSHDILSSGNEACWVCHDNTYEYIAEGAGHSPALVLTDGTLLSTLDSPTLCSQCHEKRYKAWKEGTHGISAWKVGVSATAGDEQVWTYFAPLNCPECHDPHQPQIALLDITKPHPPPALSSSSPPSVVLSAVLGGSLLLTMALGILLAKKGKKT